MGRIIRRIVCMIIVLVCVLSMKKAEGDTMVCNPFETAINDSNVVIALLLVGVVCVLFMHYFFKFQQYKKAVNDVSLRFEPAYIVGFIASLVVSFAVAYVFTFGVMPEVFNIRAIEGATIITDSNTAIFMSIVIGAVSAGIMDRFIVHPYVDGTRTSVKNFQKLASIRSSNNGFYVDPVLKEKVIAKGKLYGLNDEQCARLCLLVKDENDPQFAIVAGFVKKN